MTHCMRKMRLVRGRRPLRKIGCAIWLLIAATICPTSSGLAKVRLTPLGEMTASAGTIISGKVIEVRDGVHPDYPNVEVTFVTLRVEESFKNGEPSSSSLTFMQLGGTGTTRIQELPAFKSGERVIVFLYPKSQYGLTSPVGGSQGKFILRNDPANGVLQAGNGMNNWKLFSDVRLDRQFSASERKTMQSERGATDYSTLKSILRKLVKGSAH